MVDLISKLELTLLNKLYRSHFDIRTMDIGLRVSAEQRLTVIYKGMYPAPFLSKSAQSHLLDQFSQIWYQNVSRIFKIIIFIVFWKKVNPYFGQKPKLSKKKLC